MSIQAACPNGHTFVMRNLIGASAGTTVQMQDVRIGPCPVCGESGRIRDGIYTLREHAGRLVTAFRSLSYQDLTKAREALEQAKRLGTDGAIDEAVKNLPDTVRAAVQDIVRKEGSRSNRLALIALLLTIIAWFFPKAPSEVVAEVAHLFHKSPAVTEPAPTPANESELEQVVARVLEQLCQEQTMAPGKLGRNESCWCGSGKKYKYCHLRMEKR